MVGIQFNQQQIKAYQEGATMFIFPIQEDIFIHDGTVTFDNKAHCWSKSDYIKAFSPLLFGGKFFIQEDFQMIVDGVCSVEVSADKMKAEDARFKDVCLNVAIKRLQDITIPEWEKIQEYKMNQNISHKKAVFFENIREWTSEQNINYKDNPYIFLYTVKSD